MFGLPSGRAGLFVLPQTPAAPGSISFKVVVAPLRKKAALGVGVGGGFIGDSPSHSCERGPSYGNIGQGSASQAGVRSALRWGSPAARSQIDRQRQQGPGPLQ